MLFKIFKEFIARRRDQKIHKISVYGIFSEKPELNSDGTIKNKNIVPISFAKNFTQATDIVDRLLYYKYFSHFTVWIKYSKHSEVLPSIQSDLWNEYKSTVIYNKNTLEPDYYVLGLTYTNEEFASLLRIFSTCDLVYMDHETAEEILEYVKRTCDNKGKIILPENLSRVVQEDPYIQQAVEQAYKQATTLAEARIAASDIQKNN